MSGVEHGGDRLDLHQLVLVSQHGDAHQCAGHVMVAEGVPEEPLELVDCATAAPPAMPAAARATAASF